MHHVYRIQGSSHTACSTCPVGIECLVNLQRKWLIFEGNFTLQSDVQLLDSFVRYDPWVAPSNQASLLVFVLSNILYIDRTENIPFESHNAMWRNHIDARRVLSGIFWITSLSMGIKNWQTFSIFHVASVPLIKSLADVGGLGAMHALGRHDPSWGSQLSFQGSLPSLVLVILMMDCFSI